MKDTDSAAQRPRRCRSISAQGGGFTRRQAGHYKRDISRRGGLVSTPRHLQFAQMLVNGGELNGKRFLGPRTIALMASNHTGDLVAGQFGRPARGVGFGLGVQVVEDPVAADLRVSKGAWSWPGAYGTSFQIEPAERMVTIVMMQVSTPALQRDFEAAVSQAIVQ